MNTAGRMTFFSTGGEIKLECPVTDKNIDALIMILEGMKETESKEPEDPIEQSREEIKFIDMTPKVKTNAWKKKRGRPRLKPEVWPKKEKPDRHMGKYTPEVKEFIVENLAMKNRDLAEALNKKFNMNATANGIAFYKSSNGLTKKKKDKKVIPQNTPKKEKRYDLMGRKRTKKCEKCGINIWEKWKKGKRLCSKCYDYKEDSDTDSTIQEFVNKSKITDAYAMRDTIIEKFEKDIPMDKIRKMIGKRLDKKDQEEILEEDNDLDMEEFE